MGLTAVELIPIYAYTQQAVRSAAMHQLAADGEQVVLDLRHGDMLAGQLLQPDAGLGGARDDAPEGVQMARLQVERERVRAGEVAAFPGRGVVDVADVE
jgi:hypothetical protein